MSGVATTAHVPAVRFKGFEGDWECHKFKELARIRRGLTYSPLNVRKSGVRVLRSSNINEDTFAIREDDVFVELKAINIDFARDKDILITSANGSSRLVGKHALINNIPDKTVHGGFMLLATADEPYFINSLMSSPWYTKFINLYVAGGNGAIGNLNKSDLEAQEIFAPKLIEQTKIGEYFHNLDTLIALQQQKYEKLQNVKKAMLAQMFPAPGATTPAVRFAGFTAPWQDRKLGDLCVKFVDGDWIESKDQSDSGVRLIQTGNIGVAKFIEKPDNLKWVSFETFERLHCEEVLPGDILISRLPEPAGRACIVPNLGVTMITAVDCTIVRTSSECDNGFLIQYLSSQDYFNQVNTELGGGTRQRIGRSNLSSFKVPIPTDYEEQKKIGKYFSDLDNLITLQRRKLEKLQCVKKACLEGMFV